MRSIDDKPIFANLVVGQGINNGVVNMTLGAFLFSPSEDGKTAVPDPVIVGRLRMDIPCARQMMASLQNLLQSHDASVATAKAANGDGAEAKPEEAERSLN